MDGNIVALPLLHHPSKSTLKIHPETHEFHMDDALKGLGADSRHKFSGLAFKNQKLLPRVRKFHFFLPF